jgi:hypothetical protein
MSFLDQPVELLVQQIKDLPIVDLLSVCQTNKYIADVCNIKGIWIDRIRKEFPEVDIKLINNPREYYLNKVLFRGEIYVHQPRENAQGYIFEQVDNVEYTTYIQNYDVITYDQIFEKVEEIAKHYSNDYLIIYSTHEKIYPNPDHGKIYFNDIFQEYEVTGIQIPMTYLLKDLDDVPCLTKYYNDNPPDVGIEISPEKNIILYDDVENTTQVDIILIDRSNITLLNQGRNEIIRDFLQKHRYVSFKHNGYKYIYHPYEICDTLEITGGDPKITRIIARTHKFNNTPSHQRYVKPFDNRSSIIANPIIPRFRNFSYLDFDRRKEKLIKFVTSALPNDDNGIIVEGHMGFHDYDDFVKFQEDYINAMDEEQIITLEFLRNEILPISLIDIAGHYGDEYSQAYTENDIKFYFDAMGRIVIIWNEIHQ